MLAKYLPGKFLVSFLERSVKSDKHARMKPNDENASKFAFNTWLMFNTAIADNWQVSNCMASVDVY